MKILVKYIICCYRKSREVICYINDELSTKTYRPCSVLDISGKEFAEVTPDDLTPPLEHCIRTK